MSQYKLKTPKGMEETVVGAYKKIESGVVGAYKKIEGRFVDTFLEKIEDDTAACDKNVETQTKP